MRYLAGAIAAELGDDNLGLRVGCKQCQRQADIIVEALGRLVDAKMPAQNVVGNLPCSRFARRACYCDYLESRPPAVFPRKIAERPYRILDAEYALAASLFNADGLAYDSTGSPFLKGVTDIIMAVKILAFDGEETIAGLDRPRIDAHAAEAVSRSP
jgi:hypothetical protein